MDNPFDPVNYIEQHPSCIVQGSFIGWKLSRDFDPALFSLSYRMYDLDGSPPEEVIVEGTASVIGGQDFWVFEVPTVDSSAWSFTSDVEVRWNLSVIRLSDNSQSIIETGFLSIFSSDSGRRTHAEIMLSKINSILQGRADSDVASYSIKSRSISKLSIEELIMWRNYYIDEIKRTGGSVDTADQTEGIAGRNGTVRTRFVN